VTHSKHIRFSCGDQHHITSSSISEPAGEARALPEIISREEGRKEAHEREKRRGGGSRFAPRNKEGKGPGRGEGTNGRKKCVSQNVGSRSMPPSPMSSPSSTVNGMVLRCLSDADRQWLAAFGAKSFKASVNILSARFTGTESLQSENAAEGKL